MTFKFYYNTDEEEAELKNILDKECQHHFGQQGNPMNWYRSMDKSEKRIFVCIDNKLYFDDLQKMRLSVYSQNKKNLEWHKEYPYPQLEHDVLIREDIGWENINIVPTVARIDATCDYWYSRIAKDEVEDGEIVYHEPQKDKCWKEIMPDEILLNDFYEEVTENLSFVPRVEVENGC